MSEDGPSGRPWLVPLGIGVAFFLVGLAVWQPAPVGVLHDDGVYVLLGRSLAQGEGLHYVGVPGSPPAAKFPPLYPAVLAGLWKLSPEFPANLVVFEVASLAFLAVAAGLFTAFALALPGVSAGAAAAVAALGFGGIEVWRTALVPLSEPLFLLLLVGGLILAHRVESQRAPPVGAWAALAGVLVLLVHTRTVGVALPLGLALSLLSRKRVRAPLAVALATGLALVPWTLWGVRASARLAPSLRDVLGPYGPWVLEQVSGAGESLVGTLAGQASALTAHYVTALLPGLGPGVRALALLTLAPVLVLGGATLWRHSRTTLLTLMLYLLAVWIWPFKDFRLIAPSFPLLALLFGLGMIRLTALEGHRSLRRGALTLGAFWAVWFAGTTVLGYARGAHLEGFADRTLLLSEAMAAVQATTPESAVVGAPDAWAAVTLYTGRQAAPSARFLPLAPGGPTWGTPDQQLAQWAEIGVTHVLVEHGGQVHGAALDALTRRCGEGSVRTLRDLPPGGRLVSLPPPGRCPGAGGSATGPEASGPPSLQAPGRPGR